MSYLDVPRIHFGGKFFADPSTVNNDPRHYDPKNPRPPSPWQEPHGTHRFSLVDCTVRSVVGSDGQAVNADPLLGVSVETTTAGRLVDLDVYQQGVSTIYGLQVRIVLDQAQKISLAGALNPSPVLNSAYFKRLLPTRGWTEDYGQASYGKDSNASGCFKTLFQVDEDKWPAGVSPVLDALRAVSGVVNGKVILSIKFTLDGYINVYYNPDNRHGRITGAIGPAHESEPIQATGPRWLFGRPLPKKAEWWFPNFYGASFNLDAGRKKLVLDLANALCLQRFRGPTVDLGDLTAVVQPPGQKPVPLGIVPMMEYSQFGYENNASICEITLTDQQVGLLESNPLALVTSRKDIGPQKVLTESKSGLYFAPDQRVWRINSGPDRAPTQVNADVWVTKFGAPLSGKNLNLTVQPVHGDTPGATVPPTNPGDTPQADGALVAQLTPSNERGLATLTMRVVKDPGSRTQWLDGQLYFIWIHEGPKPPKAPPQESTLSVLAWSQYPVNESPSWKQIQQLMEPYKIIYPAMTEAIDLTDEHTFEVFADNPPWWVSYGADKNYSRDGFNSGAIAWYMTLPFEDPDYMPISRDLSPNKVRTVLNYVKLLQGKKFKPTVSNGKDEEVQS